MGRGSSGIKRQNGTSDDYAFKDSPDDGRMTVKVRGEHGESETVEVSVQNMSALDDRELTAAQFARLRGSSVGQKLARVAEANSQNDNIKDAYTFSEGKEGTLRKANSVPVVAYDNRNGSAMTLESRSGYVTKINGEDVYLQKNQGGGYTWNVSGLSLAQSYKTVSAAKDSLPKVTETIKDLKSNRPQMLDNARGTLRLLNKNNGRIDRRVWNAIDQRDIEALGREW